MNPKTGQRLKGDLDTLELTPQSASSTLLDTLSLSKVFLPSRILMQDHSELEGAIPTAQGALEFPVAERGYQVP
jgi:hypothetical protein